MVSCTGSANCVPSGPKSNTVPGTIVASDACCTLGSAVIVVAVVTAPAGKTSWTSPPGTCSVVPLVGTVPRVLVGGGVGAMGSSPPQPAASRAAASAAASVRGRSTCVRNGDDRIRELSVQEGGRRRGPATRSEDGGQPDDRRGAIRDWREIAAVLQLPVPPSHRVVRAGTDPGVWAARHQTFTATGWSRPPRRAASDGGASDGGASDGGAGD